MTAKRSRSFVRCGTSRHRCVAIVLVMLCLTGRGYAVEVIEGSAVDQKSGLTFEFSTRGIHKSGYRPIDLTLTRRKRINVDRRVVFNIQPRSWSGYSAKSPQLRVAIDMPEGKARVTRRVLIPQSDVWSYIHFNVFEDGEQIRSLSITPGSNRRSDERITETFPGWWFIDSDFEAVERANKRGTSNTKLLPNVRALLDFMPHYQEEYQLLQSRDYNTLDSETLDDLPKLTTVNMTGLSGLPTNWLEYSCFDIVVISFADLQRLQQERPNEWIALRTFIRQGANLVVYAVAPTRSDLDFSGLPDLSASLFGEAETAGNDWKSPFEEDYQLPLENFFPNVVYHTQSGQYRARGVGRPNQSQFYNMSEDYSATQTTGIAPTAPLKVPRASFRIRQFGLGRVVAIASHKPFRFLNNDNRGQLQWGWLLKSLGTERVMWYQRHGLSNGRRNADFWNFLLQGVGAAPVLPFLFLITVFVFFIGPVNYFTLRRWNRLYLILFTVPVCAAIVTAGLIAYAFLSDGISTRMRTRSFTLVDGDAGDAISWSRQSYYAGLPPSGGISFPENAAVFPIVYAPDEEHSNEQLLRWEDGKQILAQGYLRTRTLAQMIVCNSQPTKQRIDIQSTSAGVTAKNEFGFDVEFIMAIDPNRKVAYTTEALKSGGTAELREVALETARELTAGVLADSRLTIPPGVDFGYGTTRYWNEIDPDSTPVHTSSSILEKSIDELRLLTEQESFVYYAVTSDCHNFVPRGTDSTAEEDGFHVIKGFWNP